MPATPKLTAKPPIVRVGPSGKIAKPPLDPHSLEIVKTVSQFLGKINRHLNEKSGHKLKLIPADARVVTVKPGKKA